MIQLRRATALDPSNHIAHQALGIALGRAGEHDEAKQRTDPRQSLSSLDMTDVANDAHACLNPHLVQGRGAAAELGVQPKEVSATA